jgi:hypothetical protein
MRRIELLLKIQPESQQRRRLPRRAQASRSMWLALLAVLAMAYARSQSGISVEPEPRLAAASAQAPAAAVTPVEPTILLAAAPTPVASPPRPAPRARARPSPATPPAAPAVAPVQPRGALAPDPPALVFDTRMVRSGSADRTSSEQRSEDRVEIRRRSTVTSEVEIRSEVRSVSITNTGTAPVRIGSAELARIESEVFAVAGDSCSGNVLARPEPGAASESGFSPRKRALTPANCPFRATPHSWQFR